MSPTPVTIGRIVNYTLTEQDAIEIQRRRTNSESIRARIAEDKWPAGAQAHIGNEARAGAVYPAIVVAVWGPACCNLQVFLDGNDQFWGLSRSISPSGEPQPGFWNWPPRA